MQALVSEKAADIKESNQSCSIYCRRKIEGGERAEFAREALQLEAFRPLKR